MQQFLEPMIFKAVEIARDSQIRALSKDFSSAERTTSHQAMIFEVLRFHNGDLILPDTGLAFMMKHGVRPISLKGDSIESVVIPISSSAAIIGSKKGNFLRPLDVLNSALASCAHESFIARETQPSFDSLAQKIGRNAKLVDDAEVARIIRSIEF